jgi:hypothetical protein
MWSRPLVRVKDVRSNAEERVKEKPPGVHTVMVWPCRKRRPTLEAGTGGATLWLLIKVAFQACQTSGLDGASRIVVSCSSKESPLSKGLVGLGVTGDRSVKCPGVGGAGVGLGSEVNKRSLRGVLESRPQSPASVTEGMVLTSTGVTLHPIPPTRVRAADLCESSGSSKVKGVASVNVCEGWAPKVKSVLEPPREG